MELRLRVLVAVIGLLPSVGLLVSCITGGVHVYSCDDPCGNGEPGWTRACSPCTCGPPSGGNCEAEVSLYEDGDCAVSLLPAPEPANMVAHCKEVLEPDPLGSMSAELTIKEPGACTPGGGTPSGEARPMGPSLFCCRPTPGGSE